MDSYLLELRIGYARWRLKQNIDHITTKFHLTKESPEVPHLSLYGSFTINSGYNIRDLKKRWKKLRKNTTNCHTTSMDGKIENPVMEE